MNKKFLLLSIIIIIVAAVPRSIELLNHNYLFGFDQGLFFEAVKKIVVDRDLTLIGAEVGGRGGFFQGPGWYYLLAIPFFITNGDPYGAMVLMFFIGILTVGLSIFLIKKMFGWRESLVVGFLIAISPAVITQSRFIWPPFPVSLLIVLFLYFLFQVLKKRDHFLPFLTLTIGLIVHFEVATAGTLFLQTLILSPILFIKKLVAFKYVVLALASFLFALSPLILFDFRNEFIITKGIFRLASGSDAPHAITQVYLIHMFANHLDIFKYNLANYRPSMG